jgi:hypothetical protein
MLPFIQEILSAFETDDSAQSISVTGEGDLPSWFAVTDLATASVATAGVFLSRYAGRGGSISVDRRLASFWFGSSLRPVGWDTPSPWDPLAGDYQTADGWIRLHTNAPAHRVAALSVLGPHETRAALEPLIAEWLADDLEAAIVDAKGCAATMRDFAAWAVHPQGKAVAQDPLVLWQQEGRVSPLRHETNPARPLKGIKVLDLTRVLAGPVAGRFLAAYGADVLRIDPRDWDEPGTIPEVTLGKRCAGLNLKINGDRAVFEALLAEADVLLHGYRPGALDNLGYDAESLRTINPGLINVSLNAYGWSGPWATRRGFDSLVQMSCGIADYGQRMAGSDRPVPLPVQALDHATGYLLAASVLHALSARKTSGVVLSARLSLARVGLLLSTTQRDTLSGGLQPESADDQDPALEHTDWGPAHRVKFPLAIEGVDAGWSHPATTLRSAAPVWQS